MFFHNGIKRDFKSTFLCSCKNLYHLKLDFVNINFSIYFTCLHLALFLNILSEDFNASLNLFSKQLFPKLENP